MTNNDKRNHCDEWIDHALSAYSAAEPVHGLEERVLRRIDGDRGWRRKPWRGWVRFAGPAAGVLGVGVAGAGGWQKALGQAPHNVPLLGTGHPAPPASSSPPPPGAGAPRAPGAARFPR